MNMIFCRLLKVGPFNLIYITVTIIHHLKTGVLLQKNILNKYTCMMLIHCLRKLIIKLEIKSEH